ncbi:hypothetical protein BDW74DRAFT_52184 [Aspergillus multicolor]|uniref:uncharacterized protein n=1 Tax=Aspergillus multicolor TaxID=41759 RepID=UPI003CCD598F
MPLISFWLDGAVCLGWGVVCREGSSSSSSFWFVWGGKGVGLAVWRRTRTSWVSTKRAGVARFIKRPIRVSRPKRSVTMKGELVVTKARERRGKGSMKKEVNVGRRGPCVSEM